MTHHPVTQFDSYAAAYRRARFPHEDVATLLADLGFVGSSASVLDLGCGGLRETKGVVQCVKRFVGLDNSSKMLVNEDMMLGAELVVADFNHPLPFDAETFSHVVGISMLHHASSPQKLISEISRVSTSSSTVVFVSNTPWQVSRRATYRFFPQLRTMATSRFPRKEIILSTLAHHGYVPMYQILRRPSIIIDRNFLNRLNERAFDSSFFLISDEEWSDGMAKLRKAVASGDELIYPRNRIVYIGVR